MLSRLEGSAEICWLNISSMFVTPVILDIVLLLSWAGVSAVLNPF
jgi:hypothetical protein